MALNIFSKLHNPNLAKSESLEKEPDSDGPPSDCLSVISETSESSSLSSLSLHSTFLPSSPASLRLNKVFPQSTFQTPQAFSTGGASRVASGNDIVADIGSGLVGGSAMIMKSFATVLSAGYAVGLGVSAYNNYKIATKRIAGIKNFLHLNHSPQTHHVSRQVINQHRKQKKESIGLGITSGGAVFSTIVTGLKITGQATATALLAASSLVSGVGFIAYGLSQNRSDRVKRDQISETIPAILTESLARKTENNTKHIEYEDKYREHFVNYERMLKIGCTNSAVLSGASAVYSASAFMTLGVVVPITSAAIGVSSIVRLNVIEPKLDSYQFKPITANWFDPYDMISKRTRGNDHSSLLKLEEIHRESKSKLIAKFGFFQKRILIPLASLMGNSPAFKNLPNWVERKAINLHMKKTLMRTDNSKLFCEYAEIQSKQICTTVNVVMDMLNYRKEALLELINSSTGSEENMLSEYKVNELLNNYDNLLTLMDNIKDVSQELKNLVETRQPQPEIEAIKECLSKLQNHFINAFSPDKEDKIGDDDSTFCRRTDRIKTPLEMQKETNENTIKVFQRFASVAEEFRKNMYHLQAQEDYEVYVAKKGFSEMLLNNADVNSDVKEAIKISDKLSNIYVNNRGNALESPVVEGLKNRLLESIEKIPSGWGASVYSSDENKSRDINIENEYNRLILPGIRLILEQANGEPKNYAEA